MARGTAPHNLVAGATLFSRGEVQRFCRQILESETYREQLTTDLCKRDASTRTIEPIVWYYAYGKPIEQVHMTVSAEDLSTLSIAQLQQKAKEAAQELEEAMALEAAIDLDQNGNVTQGPWAPKEQP